MRKTEKRSIACTILCAIVLFGFTPLGSTSCEQQPAEIKVTLETDMSSIIAAINNANTTLTQKMSTIEKAMSDGLADSKAAIDLVRKAVDAMGGTMAEKMSAIEAAIQSQTTSLETKLALVEAAVNAGFADAATQQGLLQQAVESLSGTMEEKLAAIETAIQSQTTSLETKIGLIEAAVTTGFADAQAAQELIKASIETLGGTMEEKLAAIEAALASQTTDLSAKLALIETAVKEGFAEEKDQQELLQKAIETLDGTMEEKLAALEEAMKSQTTSLETKLEAIETAAEKGLADASAKLALIQQAVASLGGDMDKKLDAIKEAVTSQTTSLETKLAAIETAVNSGASSTAAKLDLIKQAIESSGTTVAQKLEELTAAVTGIATSLPTKLEAIESAVTSGIINVNTALALVQSAVEALLGTLVQLETDLSNKIDEVSTAIAGISATLTTGQVAQVLAQILSAINGKTDYTDILETILADIEGLSGTTIHGHKFVEMGDGLKWATMNVGAKTPDGYGQYFAWGETEAKDTFSWDNYKYGTQDNLTKYNGTDGKVVLEISDDAARANWKGTWRIPTKAEWENLMNPADFQWDFDATKGGYTVTSKVSGYEGNSIFLPAADTCNGGGVGVYGYYWSVDVYTGTYNNAMSLSFSPTNWQISALLRCDGFPVRAVSN